MTNESEDYPAHCFLSQSMEHGRFTNERPGRVTAHQSRWNMGNGNVEVQPSVGISSKDAIMGKCKTCCPTQTMQDYSNPLLRLVQLFPETPYTSLSEPVIATCCCDTPSTPAELHAVAKSITIQARYCLSGTRS